VVEPTQLKNMSQNWNLPNFWGENKHYLKPPTSLHGLYTSQVVVWDFSHQQ